MELGVVLDEVASGNPDLGGLTNLRGQDETFTDPALADTDGDTFDDLLEVELNSDPTDVNSVPDLQIGYTETGSN